MGLTPDNPVLGGTVLRRAAEQSPNYVPGVSGWSINQDGSAEFSDITVHGGTGIPKITVSDTAPANAHADDLWIDNAAGNSVHVYDGTQWNLYQWGSIALAAGSVNSAAIVAGAVIAEKIASEAITAEKIAAGIVIAGIVNGTTITGSKIETSAIAPNIVIDGPDNRITFTFSTGSTPAIIETGGEAGGIEILADKIQIGPTSLGVTSTDVELTGELVSAPSIGNPEDWHDISKVAGWTGILRCKLVPLKSFVIIDGSLSGSYQSTFQNITLGALAFDNYYPTSLRRYPVSLTGAPTASTWPHLVVPTSGNLSLIIPAGSGSVDVDFTQIVPLD